MKDRFRKIYLLPNWKEIWYCKYPMQHFLKHLKFYQAFNIWTVAIVQFWMGIIAKYFFFSKKNRHLKLERFDLIAKRPDINDFIIFINRWETNYSKYNQMYRRQKQYLLRNILFIEKKNLIHTIYNKFHPEELFSNWEPVADTFVVIAMSRTIRTV